MTQNTIQIGKHTLVGGLTWLALSRPRDLKNEAIENAKKVGGDCYLIRTGVGAVQVGVGGTSDGVAPGQLSFAAAVTEAVARNENLAPGRKRLNDWLAVLKITDEVYGFVAVRDGSILPNGDYIGPLDEAIGHLEQSYGVGGWAAVFGSPEVAENGYHNFVEVDLAKLLSIKSGKLENSKQFALRSTEPKLSRKAVLVVTSIAIVSTIAVSTALYYRHQAQVEAELERQRLELANLEASSVQRQTLSYPKVWQQQPAAVSFMVGCHLGLQHLNPGGWKMAMYSCTQNGIETLYQRAGSTASMISAVLPDVTLDPQGENAVLMRPMHLNGPSAEDLIPFSAIQTSVLSDLQGLQISYSMTDGKMPAPPVIPDDKREKTDLIPPTWREYGFSAGPTSLHPQLMSVVLGKPGVRINRINFQDQSWSYEGTIYAE